MNQETKASLHTLLNIAHLDNLCHEEKKQEVMENQTVQYSFY